MCFSFELNSKTLILQKDIYTLGTSFRATVSFQRFFLKSLQTYPLNFSCHTNVCLANPIKGGQIKRLLFRN